MNDKAEQIRELIAPFRNCVNMNSDFELNQHDVLDFLVNLEAASRKVLRICNELSGIDENGNPRTPQGCDR